MQVTGINNNISPVFNSFLSRGISSSRNSSINTLKKMPDLSSNKHLFSITGALVGIVIPMVLMRNKKATSFIKSFVTIDYTPTKIISMGNSALFGGFIGGLLDNKNSNKKEKAKELAYSSLCDMTLPTIFSSILLKKTENLKIKNQALNTLSKFGLNFAGFCTGLIAGREILGIFDKNIKKEHPIKPKDFLMMADDVPTILALTKQNILGIDQLIPVCAFALGKETDKKG